MAIQAKRSVVWQVRRKKQQQQYYSITIMHLFPFLLMVFHVNITID